MFRAAGAQEDRTDEAHAECELPSHARHVLMVPGHLSAIGAGHPHLDPPTS
jgi:hypothetical protein